MIKITLLLLLPFFLYASKILNYNIYDRTDRVDIMLTFDTPYDGVIKQSSSRSKIVLTLTDVTIEAPKSKEINSEYLQSIAIVPLQNATQIIATVPNKDVILHASKTTDGYGLRLRFIKKRASQTETKGQTKEADSPLSFLPTKKDTEISSSYIIVIVLMLFGVIVLLYLKAKISKKQKKEPWLFNTTTEKAKNETKKVTNQTNKEPQNVSIRFQKVINNGNSVVMLDFGAQSYLVLMGNSNILLDKFNKFTDKKPSSQQEFESILQDRYEELEAFLSDSQKPDVEKNRQDALQSYTEKAANFHYSVND